MGDAYNNPGDDSDDDDVVELKNKYLTSVTPHGNLTKVVENVYIVRGSQQIGFGVAQIPRTMTVIKQKGSSKLVIINAIRVNEMVLSQINILGKVCHVVRLSNFQGCDDYFYLKTYKKYNCQYWCLTGSVKDPSTLPPGIVTKKDKETPIVRLQEGVGEKCCPIKDAKVFVLKDVKTPEAMIYIPNGKGTLITCDALQNVGGDDVLNDEVNLAYTNFGGRTYLRVNRYIQSCTCPPMYRMSQTIPGKEIYPNFQKLFWSFPEFENFVPGHGIPQVGNAKKKIQAALSQVWPDQITMQQGNDEEDDDEEEEKSSSKNDDDDDKK